MALGRLASIFSRQPRENLGLGVIAARLRQHGYNVRILNLGTTTADLSQTCAEIVRDSPGLVGISVLYDLHLYAALAFAVALRTHGYRGHLTAGGPFATLAHPYLLATCPELDSVVLGEGVETALDLVTAIEIGGNAWRQVTGIAWARENSIIVTGPGRVAPDLSALPFAARDSLFALRQQGVPLTTAAIYSSVGCHGRCKFCSAPTLSAMTGGRPWRARSAASVVDEMVNVSSELGIFHFYFCDDSFAGHGPDAPARLEHLARCVRDRALGVRFRAEIRADACGDPRLLESLQKAGLAEVLLGLESGSQSTLNRFGKQTPLHVNASAWHTVRNLGIDVEPSMILVDPLTTVHELRDTVEFIGKHRLYDTRQPLNLFNQLVVFPGTPMERHLAASGLVTVPDPWETPADAASDDVLLRRCRHIAHRGYTIRDPAVRTAWNALAAASHNLSTIDAEKIPILLASDRLSLAGLEQSTRNSQRDRYLVLLKRVRSWRKGLPELVMTMLEAAARWCEAAGAGNTITDGSQLSETLATAMKKHSSSCFDGECPW